MNHKDFEYLKDTYISKYNLVCDLADTADSCPDMLTKVYNLWLAKVLTADTITIKKAHWIDRTDWLGTLAIYKYECSNCGFTIGHKPFNRADGKGDKFCEECGCKMSLESEES